MQNDNRGLLEETWTTGSSRESRDCLAKTTASCKKSKAETHINTCACMCVCACDALRKRLRNWNQAETYMHAVVLIKPHTAK
jgi:hypothetical protein